ncbi:MAG: tRNA lysidine(34) synthetase TilS [Solirubrobacterales bacterium]
MSIERRGEVERVRAAVRAGGLLDGVPALVAMLSGGRDSVCLLDVAVALRGAGAVRALHVNYGLRAAADEDERHCASLCAELGVELSIVRAGQAPGKEQGNLQAWARELRYDAAERLARELDRDAGEVELGTGSALIATGHTASDQVETILYRLAASPGRRALLGMSPAEGRLVRPLLDAAREQTAAYCEERGLRWREDASNEDERFARVRVRKLLVPALREIHPAAESNVLRTARLLREEAELLDALVERELGDDERIRLERLAELSPALARLVVIRLAERAVGTYVPQAGERVAELLALGERGGRGELHLGRFAGAVVDDGVLSMRRLAPGESSERLGAPPDGD